MTQASLRSLLFAFSASLLFSIPSDACRLVDAVGQDLSADTASRVVQSESPSRWTWQARSGDELRCDVEGFEPLDLRCDRACGGGQIQVGLVRGRTVELAADAPRDVDVEWRRLGAPGEPTELLATRTVSLTGGKASIPVASADDRILRIRAGDASPHTVFVARREGEEARPPVVRVGKALSGGETFGFLEAAPGDGEPKLHYLEGVTAPSFRALLTLGEFGEFSLRGLNAGVYRPRAVYAGGAASVGPEVEVSAGETTELIPWRVEEPEPVAESVPADAVATLLGTVRVGVGEPVPDLRVEAVPTNRDGEVEETDKASSPGHSMPSATTDAEGRFVLTLPTAGWWQLRVSTSSGFPVREQAMELAEGETEQDFDLGDAAVSVRIERDDGEPLSEPVTVELRRGRGGQEVARAGTLQPGGDAADAGEVLLLDLDFDRYQVSAYSESGWASVERARVALSKANPVAEVVLVLSQDRRVAVVRMPDGSPATDVLAALDRRQLYPSSPGEFELTGASRRSEVRILPTPDYVGVCRRVEDHQRIEIELQPATAEAVLIPARDRMPPTGRYLGVIEGLPGSDCPMPVALQWEPFQDEHGRERIRVPGLVPGIYSLRIAGGAVRELIVPGDPVPLGADAAPGSSKND